jgi:hypothetical protein
LDIDKNSSRVKGELDIRGRAQGGDIALGPGATLFRTEEVAVRAENLSLDTAKSNSIAGVVASIDASVRDGSLDLGGLGNGDDGTFMLSIRGKVNALNIRFPEYGRNTVGSARLDIEFGGERWQFGSADIRLRNGGLRSNLEWSGGPPDMQFIAKFGGTDRFFCNFGIQVGIENIEIPPFDTGKAGELTGVKGSITGGSNRVRLSFSEGTLSGRPLSPKLEQAAGTLTLSLQEDIAGTWRSKAEVVKQIRRVCFVHRAIGERSIFGRWSHFFFRRLSRAQSKIRFPAHSKSLLGRLKAWNPGWYDIHARHRSADP